MIEINEVMRYVSQYGDKVAPMIRSGADELVEAAAGIRAGRMTDAAASFSRGMEDVLAGTAGLMDSSVRHPAYSLAIENVTQGAGMLGGSIVVDTSRSYARDIAVRTSSLTDVLAGDMKPHVVANAIDEFARRAKVVSAGAERESLFSRARGLDGTAGRVSWHENRGTYGYVTDISPYGDYIGPGQGYFARTSSPSEMHASAAALRARADDLAAELESLGVRAPREHESVASLWAGLRELA